MKSRWLCMLPACSVLAAVSVAALAQQAEGPGGRTKTFELLLTTETMALPFKLPNLANMPKIPGLEGLGKPHRTIGGHAFYPDGAVAPIFVGVPADLGLKDNKLVLELPKPAGGGAEAVPGPQGAAGTPPKMTFEQLLYWHPDKAEGPVTTKVDTAALPPVPTRPGAKAPVFGPIVAPADLAKTATGSEDVKPEGTVGKGDYVLNTGGTAALDGFLPAIQVTAPEQLNEQALEDGFEVTWKPVAGARGYIIHAMGMSGVPGQDQNVKATVWVSTLKQPPDRVIFDYTQATTIADDVKDGILLPPDTTSCRVPGGILKGSKMVMLRVTAVGNDFYDDSAGVKVIGKIRSRWSLNWMGGMGGVGGMMGGGGAPGGLPAGLGKLGGMGGG